MARAEFGVRSITSVANEVRQILWPDGDDAISAIDAVHTLDGVVATTPALPSPQRDRFALSLSRPVYRYPPSERERERENG